MVGLWAALSAVFCVSVVYAQEGFTDRASRELERYAKDPKAYYEGTRRELTDADRAERDRVRQLLVERGTQTRVARGFSSTVTSGTHDFAVTRELAETAEWTRNLAALDARVPHSASTTIDLWSDDYWALYAGQTAKRYEDARFPTGNWEASRRYASIDSPGRLEFASRDAERINRLSPAEKLDALHEDTGLSVMGNLTESAWRSGEVFSRTPTSEWRWMGICHGWAAAAMMVPRPKKAIDVMTPVSRVPVRFYPADIRALASLLWAQNGNQIHFVGRRCESARPETDPETGRVLDSACNDVNPADFFLALLHRVGVDRKSLVMDATFSAEVWNHPVSGYEYAFFNPETRRVTQDLGQAMIKRRDFDRDRLRRFRSQSAKYLVGVALEVSYLTETSPHQRETASTQDDAHRKATWLFDLEIDATGAIIGGEWYQREHPDFLWVPVRGSRAQVLGEERHAPTELWDGSAGVSFRFLDFSKQAARGGSPLGYWVESLIALGGGT